MPDCLEIYKTRRKRTTHPWISRGGLRESKLDPPWNKPDLRANARTTDRTWPKSGQKPKETGVACDKYKPDLSWNKLDPGRPNEKQAMHGPNNEDSGKQLHTLEKWARSAW